MYGQLSSQISHLLIPLTPRLCAGAVRTKNVQNTMLKNLLDACGASVAFFAIGYALAFGGTEPESPKKTFIGTENFFLKDVDDLGFWMFQYAFSAASVTIVAGTLAERCQMAACRYTRMPCVVWIQQLSNLFFNFVLPQISVTLSF